MASIKYHGHQEQHPAEKALKQRIFSCGCSSAWPAAATSLYVRATLIITPRRISTRMHNIGAPHQTVARCLFWEMGGNRCFNAH